MGVLKMTILSEGVLMPKVPYTPPEAEAVERMRPEIRNVEDFWCWLNTWGDSRLHSFSTRGESDAYRQCIRDAMDALKEAGIGFEQVRDGAWSRWSGWRRSAARSS